jgi:hypothetical protein
MNGPFFTERGIVYFTSYRGANDHGVGALVVAGLEALDS